MAWPNGILWVAIRNYPLNSPLLFGWSQKYFEMGIHDPFFGEYHYSKIWSRSLALDRFEHRCINVTIGKVLVSRFCEKWHLDSTMEVMELFYLSMIHY